MTDLLREKRVPKRLCHPIHGYLRLRTPENYKTLFRCSASLATPTTAYINIKMTCVRSYLHEYS
jgi:hypothetical protein